VYRREGSGVITRASVSLARSLYAAGWLSVALGSVLICFLVGLLLVPLVISFHIHAKKSKLNPILVEFGAHSSWTSKYQAKFKGMGFFENVFIRKRSTDIEGGGICCKRLDHNRGSRDFLGNNDAMFLRSNDSRRHGQVGWWAGQRLCQGVFPNEGMTPTLHFISRCLSPVFEIKLSLKKTVLGELHETFRNTQIRSQLPLGGYFHHIGLPLDRQQSANADSDTQNAHYRQNDTYPKSSFVVTILGGGRDDPYIGADVVIGFGLKGWAVFVLWDNRRSWRGWLIAFVSLLCLVRLGASLHREDEQRQREYHQQILHDAENVSQRFIDFATCPVGGYGHVRKAKRIGLV